MNWLVRWNVVGPYTVPPMSKDQAFRRLAVLFGVGLLVLAACGSDTSDPQTQTFSLEFSNSASEGLNFVRTIDKGDQAIQYGTLVFEGPGNFADQSIETELLAYLSYVNGAGPAGGYLTITTADGDELAFSLSLTATNENDRVELSGRFDVISGTGRFAGVTGSGTGSGVRDATVGSSVQWIASLDLAGLEN
jgi:hypothetical protein